MKVTHLLVETTKNIIPNPYYSPSVSNIEPETIEEYRNKVVHFYSVKDVQNYIENNPKVLEEDNRYTFYKVELIRPKRTVTIDVSL